MYNVSSMVVMYTVKHIQLLTESIQKIIFADIIRLLINKEKRASRHFRFRLVKHVTVREWILEVILTFQLLKILFERP